MPTCATCSAELRPQWKFCIHCGTPVPEPVDEPDAVAAPQAVAQIEAIPSAIRPSAQPQPRINRLAIASLIVGVFGGVLGIVLGHLALRQLTTSGERGVVLARLATMCGYIWLIIYVFAAAIIWLNA